jgi:hypothetical protein
LKIVPKNIVSKDIIDRNENKNIPMAQNMSNDMFWASFPLAIPPSPLHTRREMGMAGCGGFRVVVRHDMAIAVAMFVVVWQAGSAGVVVMTWLLVAAGAVVTQLAALVLS